MNSLLKVAGAALLSLLLLVPVTAQQLSLTPIAVTASTTLGTQHVGTTVVVNAAAGLTLTLPDASGTGREYDILIGTTVTSNNVVVAVANASDVMTGVQIMAQDAADTAVIFETASTSDTCTMNGSTKGGIKGDRIVLKDVAADLWLIQIIGSGTSTEATCFSAAVS
jgi:hypothetical protein